MSPLWSEAIQRRVLLVVLPAEAAPMIWYADDTLTLHHGDSLIEMASMADASVDAIVTSPEYADQRKYLHGANTKPAAYSEMFAPFLSEMLRVLRPDGSLCPPGGLVLDPFIGSGTTAVAAIQRGRRAVGIDRNEAYLMEARRRVAEVAPEFDFAAAGGVSSPVAAPEDPT